MRNDEHYLDKKVQNAILLIPTQVRQLRGILGAPQPSQRPLGIIPLCHGRARARILLGDIRYTPRRPIHVGPKHVEKQ